MCVDIKCKCRFINMSTDLKNMSVDLLKVDVDTWVLINVNKYECRLISKCGCKI